jgi:hypothetical protein
VIIKKKDIFAAIIINSYVGRCYFVVQKCKSAKGEVANKTLVVTLVLMCKIVIAIMFVNTFFSMNIGCQMFSTINSLRQHYE